MTEPRFNVVFDGKALPGVDIDTAKHNLAALFKSEVSAIERLFNGGHVALKRDLSQVDAQKYLNALQGAGLDARIEEQPALNLNIAEVSHSTPAPQPAASSPYAPPQAQLSASTGEYAELKLWGVDGRIGRMRYLAWSMVLVLCCIPVLFVGAVITSISDTLGSILLFAAGAAMMAAMVMIAAKRLHDLGWSAWLVLLSLVPLVNTIFSILLMVMPGNSEANLYGPPPPPNSTAVKVLAWVWIGFIILAVLGFVLVIVGGGLAMLGAAMNS